MKTHICHCPYPWISLAIPRSVRPLGLLVAYSPLAYGSHTVLLNAGRCDRTSEHLWLDVENSKSACFGLWAAISVPDCDELAFPSVACVTCRM